MAFLFNWRILRLTPFILQEVFKNETVTQALDALTVNSGKINSRF